MTRPTRADTLAWLEGTAEMMRVDLLAGNVPDDVTRPLHPHEILAGVNWAELEGEIDAVATELADHMNTDRAAFLALLRTDLEATAASAPPAQADVHVAERLIALSTTLGITAIAGASALVDTSMAWYEQRLMAAAVTGARRQLHEAEAQVGSGNVPLVDTTDIDPGDGQRIAMAARRLATHPHASVLRAAADEAYRLPGVTPGHLLGDVMTGLDALSPNVMLNTMARPAAHSATTLGRQTALRILPPAEGYYASELLDRKTCLGPDALVATASGHKKAGDVTLDDALLTHAGRHRKPSRITVSAVDETVVHVTVGGQRTVLTLDHPVMVLEGDRLLWREAGELTEGSFVLAEPVGELAGERRVGDERLRQAPDDVATRGEIRGLAGVDVRTERVPVGAVGFDDERADPEVDGPGADGRLLLEAEAHGFEQFPNQSLDAGFRLRPSVAVVGAVPASLAGGRNDSELSPALFAVQDDGWPAARLAAVGTAYLRRVPEHGSTAAAGGIHASMGQGAVSGAVAVPVLVGEGDVEDFPAADASFLDPVPASPCVGSLVRHATLLRAVEGNSLPPPRDDLPAGEARAKRVVLSVLGPAGGHRPPHVAASTDSSPGSAALPAVATRFVHEFTVVVARVEAVEHRPYVGVVFDFTVPQDGTFFAGGFLVHNCGPCHAIDGKQYATLAAGKVDYPSGGYMGCDGGDRCRGTLVAYWRTPTP